MKRISRSRKSLENSLNLEMHNRILYACAFICMPVYVGVYVCMVYVAKVHQSILNWTASQLVILMYFGAPQAASLKSG